MDWIKKNISGLVILAVAVLLAGVLFVAQGCSIDDFVKADVPREVQAKMGVPARVPLSQARDLIAEYNQKIERETKEQITAIAKIERDASRDLQVVTETWDKKLADAGADLEDFRRTSERVSLALAARVEHANEVAGFLGSLVNAGIGAAQSSGLAALPGGGILLAGLTGVAGLLIRKPGTQNEIDAAYDEGRKAALEDAKKL